MTVSKKFYERPTERVKSSVLYECGICSCYHPWEWDGDCRDDLNRYATVEDYAEINGLTPEQYFNLEIRSMEDRLEADGQ